MRKKIALLLAALLAIGLGLVGISPASAHTGDLNAKAVCQANGTYLVTYTLTLKNVPAGVTGTIKWKVGDTSFDGTPTNANGMTLVGTHTGNGDVVLGTDVRPGNATKANWGYAFTTFTNDVKLGSDGGDIALKGDCKPTKPEPKSGTDEGTGDLVCIQPLNGQGTIESWTQDWTQAYVWNAQKWEWVLGEKVYSPKVTTTTTVDARSCLPNKPDPIKGTDEGKADPVCVTPLNGTATITSWTQDWTQAYVWNQDSRSWVLGEKVYSEKVYTEGDPFASEDCIPVSTPVKPTVTEPTCETGSTIVLPETKGVVYTIDGDTVTAVPAEGFRFEGESQKVTWTFDLEPAKDCRTVVTPVKPVPTEPTCETGTTVPLPTTEGVQYTKVTNENGTVTVTATPKEGYRFEGESQSESWTFEISPAKDCRTEVTPVAPTVVQTDTCAVEGFYEIPATEGVTYLLDGQPISTGKHTGPVSGTITAQAQEGFKLTNGEWSFALDVTAATPCPTETPTPTPSPTESGGGEPPDDLPRTGSDGLLYGFSGLIALLVGGIAYAAARRRPGTH